MKHRHLMRDATSPPLETGFVLEHVTRVFQHLEEPQSAEP